MQSLTEQDLYWIDRRLPRQVKHLLQFHRGGPRFVGGGFIRACIAGEDVNDIDIFTGSKEEAKSAADALGLAMTTSRVVQDTGYARRVETDNAITVLGLEYPVQFIHRWTFDTPEKCIESFDFTIARAAVWYGCEQDESRHRMLSSCCDDRFYADLAAKRLVYCSPVREEEAGGSMLRVLKFYQRGYRIPLDSLGAVIARMATKVDPYKLPLDVASSEEGFAKVLTGMLREVDPNVDAIHE